MKHEKPIVLKHTKNITFLFCFIY